MPEWFKPYAQQLANAQKVSSSKQSEADKATAALNKQIKRDYAVEIEPIVEQAKITLGLDDAQTAAYKKDLLQREVNRRVLSAEAQVPTETASLGSATEQVTNFGEMEVLTKFKMSANDPDVLAVMEQANGNAVDLAYGLSELKTTRAAKPQPSLSANAASTSGIHTPQETPEKLVADYQKDMLAARGNVALLKQVKETARKKGVPVDTVAFV